MTKRLPRLKFKCWQCNRTYTLMPNQITEEQELIVPCPYCSAEAIVKIDRYKKKVISTLRGSEEDDPAIGYEYDFPELIPTQKPEPGRQSLSQSE